MTWQPGQTLAFVEKEIILAALQFYRENKTQTARALDISVRTLYNKLVSYGKMTEADVEKELSITQAPVTPPEQTQTKQKGNRR